MCWCMTVFDGKKSRNKKDKKMKKLEDIRPNLKKRLVEE